MMINNSYISNLTDGIFNLDFIEEPDCFKQISRTSLFYGRVGLINDSEKNRANYQLVKAIKTLALTMMMLSISSDESVFEKAKNRALECRENMKIGDWIVKVSRAYAFLFGKEKTVCFQFLNNESLVLPIYYKQALCADSPYFHAFFQYKTLQLHATKEDFLLMLAVAYEDVPLDIPEALPFKNVSSSKISETVAVKLYELNHLYLLKPLEKIVSEGIKNYLETLDPADQEDVEIVCTMLEKEELNEGKQKRLFFKNLRSLLEGFLQKFIDIALATQSPNTFKEALSHIKNSTLENIILKDIADNHLISVSEYLPYLRCLKLSNNTEITDLGISYLKGCKRLQYLSLNNCNQLTDAIFDTLKEMPLNEYLDICGTRCSLLNIERFFEEKKIQTFAYSTSVVIAWNL